MIEHLAGGNMWLFIAIKVAIVAMVFLPAISVIAMFSIWWERKVAGHIQSRVGPMHVGGWHGWAQSIADGVKLIFKEDLIPRGADSFLFRLAPYMAFAPVFAAFLALPFGPQFVYEAGLNIGVLYVLAVLSVEIMSVIMAGWGSNSKWAIYGAMREACQMVSYEIPLGLSIITGVLVAGTLNMVELGYLQGGGLWDWFIFHNPFIFASFLLYFIASLASNKRAPFDLPESESELVAGYHTEYSGLRFSFFFFAEYAGMFIVGAIQASLFMGGWNSPLGPIDPIYNMLGYDPVAAGSAYFSGAITAANTFDGKAEAINAAGGGGLTGVGLLIINLYSVFWFTAKAMIVIWIQLWLRWTLPRIRIDQVLHTCVKVLLPLSIVTLLGTAFWIALVPQAGPGFVATTPLAVPYHFKLSESGENKLAINMGPLTGGGAKVESIQIGKIEGGTLFRIEGKDQKQIALKAGETITLKQFSQGLSFKADWAGDAKATPADAALRAGSIQLTGGTVITRAGHLLGSKSGIQWFVQIVFMLMFVGLIGVCVLIMALGWMGVIFKDPKQPPKTLFPDVMPVGRDVAFTKGKPKVEAKAE
ncbi:MAG: complex I subunit 1 family protein [Phycisphaeraceae bacterium]